MNLQPFTFTFKISDPPPIGPPDQAQATPLGLTSAVPPPSERSVGAHAHAQARYRAKNREIENEKARARMRKKRESAGSTVALPIDPEVRLRQQKSSERLRASKTFAAFREHVNQYMFDCNRAAALPPHTHELSDDNLEFLFRHIQPPFDTQDQDVDMDDETSGRQTQSKLVTQSRKTGAAPSEGARAHATARPIYHHSSPPSAESRLSHRAAIKTLPTAVQREFHERARASRAKYRAHKSREADSLDEFIRRRRARQAKAAKPALTRAPVPMERDELIE
ncbi:hypothetical protein B0H13DRAFT_1911822 [Mycena leptocephala]|nr:hypothetical protein B0H13DRAFT_1911822 [Mycena leptocephala]